MSTRESAMWARLRPALAALDPVRVENPVCPGTPDVNLTTGWLELKQIRAWPRRPKSTVPVRHFTPQQRVWLVRRARAGGHAHLLLRVGEADDAWWLLFDGAVAAHCVGLADRLELHGRALRIWHPRLVDTELVAVLRGDFGV